MKKAGRNEPCPCGSGKKYKQCCLRQDDAQASATRPAAINSAENLQIAFAHHMAGRVAEAELIYRQILTAEPKHAEALHLLGLLTGDRGDYAAASALIEKAIATDAKNHSYHANLGRMYSYLDKFKQAENCYRRALALKADCAHYDALGNVLRAQQKFPEAADSYRRALVLNPDYAPAHRDLADLLQLQEKYPQALEHYRQALRLNPGLAEAHSNLGAILKRLGRSAEAIDHYRQALILNPQLADTHRNLGAALQAVGDFDAATDCFRSALALEQDYTNIHIDAHNEIGTSLCDSLILNSVEDTLLYIMSIHARCTPSDYLQAALRYGEKLAAVAQPYTQWLSTPKVNSANGADEILRIGFVSADLRTHPVGFFLENILAFLNRSKIELIAYPTVALEDDLTQRIKPYFTIWRPLVGLSNRAAAQKIYADGLHILIDLNGYTANNRLPVFAWQPAPIQVGWLGYWASTGLAAIDYIIGDPDSTPLSELDHFSERIWQLPATRLCFTPPPEIVACAELPALRNGHITFGCFNNLTKMNDAVVALWARVLHAVPAARLMLKAQLLEDVSVAELTRARFAAHGIEAQRLHLLGASPRIDYLAAYNAIDIALDPVPFTGGTTSIEGLWMGVPLLTLRGDRLIAHQGESILHNLDLVDWIAEHEQDYIERAVAHSADLQQLALLRSELRARLLVSPLCDAEKFARHFETALTGMWNEYTKDNA
jgi:protein O-GlcNAc transferase